jgi:hypothetical protein
MKYATLILAAALLWASHASGQSPNIKDSRPGIAYNANARTVTSASYAVQAEDHTLLVNATSAAVTISLPPVSSKRYPYLVLKKTDSTTNAVTIDANGSETIDGGTTLTLRSQWEWVIVHANETRWNVVSRSAATVRVVTATATLTADQLYGTLFVNTGASGSIVLTLPAPSLGMRFRVFLTAAQDVDLNPADGTQILVLTNATGDAISSAATAGNAIELVAASATTWVAFSASGTWSDAN